MLRNIKKYGAIYKYKMGVTDVMQSATVSASLEPVKKGKKNEKNKNKKLDLPCMT